MDDKTTTQEPGDTWAIVELMGHVKIAGKLTEVERFGAKMGRLDIPTADGFVTQFFGGSSVYRITPVSEDVARHVAGRSINVEPVSPWDFPKRLVAADPVKASDYDTDHDDDRNSDDDYPI